jgi:hypothetical protein
MGRPHLQRVNSRRTECYWSINTTPYPAPPPHNGLANTLEDATQAFKTRYEEMNRMGARPSQMTGTK